MKRMLIIILLFYTQIAAMPNRRITWQPVEGAWGYYLEIKSSQESIVLSETVTDNFYDISKLEPGSYSFRIATVNILKQRGESTGWISFSIEKLYIPELKSVSRKELVSSFSNSSIMIQGKNFKPESRFFLRGNGREVELADVEIVSDSEALFSFKPDSSLNGKYDLVILNRGDAESVLKDAIDIIDSEKAETDYFIGAGYAVNIPTGAWSEYYASSYTGANLYFQVSGANRGFENILFEAELDAVRYGSSPGAKKSTLTYATLGIGAGYYYPIGSLPIQVFLKFQCGPVYSIVTFDENLTGKEESSVDVFFMGGGGVRYFLNQTFFIEPGCSIKTVFYTGAFLYDAGISFTAGARF